MAEDGRIDVSITRGVIGLDGHAVPLYLADKASRRLAECAALLASAQDAGVAVENL